MFKKLLLIFSIIIYAKNFYAQTTFNLDTKIMNFISGAGSVHVYKDTILCVGFGTDSVSYYYYEAFLAKFDLSGNRISRVEEFNGDYHYYYVHDSFLNGDTLITLVDAVLRDSIIQNSFKGGILFYYDVPHNKVVRKIKIETPNGTGIMGGLTKINDSVYIALSSYCETKTCNYVDGMLTIINTNTEKKKFIQLGKKNRDDYVSSMTWNGEKIIVGSSYRYPIPGITNPYIKSYFYTVIYEVDTSGIVKTVFEGDSLLGNIKDIVSVEDGNFIFTTTTRKYHYDQWVLGYKSHIKWNLVKMDKNYKIIWQKEIGPPHYYLAKLPADCEILPSEDGDHYLIAFNALNYPWDMDQYGLDSMINAGVVPQEVGILQKISKYGATQWMRTYSKINDPNRNTVEHIFKDICPSPDGGYVMYGDLDYDGIVGVDSFANYHAWLVKVDEYGCLVPGCQEGDTVSISHIPPDKDLILYPNPASDVLYIYDDEGGKASYAITDMAGNVLEKWHGSLINHTFILQINSYPTGTYIVTRKDEKGKVRKGKFVRL